MKNFKYIGFLILLFSGVFIINSCTDDDFETPSPSTIADFEYTVDNNSTSPCTITFKNKSIEAVSYQWDFGDTTSSTDINPTKLYTKPGVYTITLKASPKTSLYYNKLIKTRTIIIKDPSAGAVKTIYFTDRSTSCVRYYALNGNAPVVQNFGHTALTKPYGMTIDTANNNVFVSDYTTSTIYRYNMDGFGLTTIADVNNNPLIKAPIGMFVYSSKLYWCQEGGIYRCNLDGTSPEVWISTPITSAPEMPIHMAFDAASQTIYFTNDKYAYTGGVYKVKLDGTGMTKLVDGTNGGGIDIDIAGGKIYYADFDKGLCMANLDGSNEVVINTSINGVFVWGIAINKNEGKIYWGNKTAQTFNRSNLDGSNPEVLISNVKPHAIAIDKFR